MVQLSKQIYWSTIIIILTIAITIVWLCEFNLGSVKQILDTKIVDVPVNVKCQFNEPDCMEGDVDGWSLAYGLVYFIVGLLYPDRYLGITIFAIAVELLCPYIGFKTRYIINPLIAITTYSLGSLIRNYQSE